MLISSFTFCKSFPLKNLSANAYNIDSISYLYSLLDDFTILIDFIIFSAFVSFPPIIGVNVNAMSSCFVICSLFFTFFSSSSTTKSPFLSDINILLTLYLFIPVSKVSFAFFMFPL